MENLGEIIARVNGSLNGFMAIPNLIAVTLLSGQVVKMTKDYLARNRGIPKR
ncbi:MAG: alanine:cation symporter family protein [Oscillospiraceae bacterium]|nr:alanine:cation symporter family protein [Oscillospiraceae bacterium]